MMSWFALLLAVCLDIVVGDPEVQWHPVRLIGRFATRAESISRRVGSGRWTGAVAWFIVVGSTVGAAALVLAAAHQLNTLAELVMSAILIYLTIAPHDLSLHARRVEHALAQADMDRARRAVGLIVGRDTELLDSQEVGRAAVEAVAESTVDGVTAPLFWGCVLGPVGAVAYRAINTLDSMWGHQDQRYQHFGWAAARADDLAGWLPARLTVVWIAVAALLLGQRGGDALRVAVRDGPRHASPNAGLGEAAFAGALGIRLGGPNRYDGEWSDGPRFGVSDRLPSPRTIRLAVRLMWATTAVSVLTLSGIGVLVSTVGKANDGMSQAIEMRSRGMQKESYETGRSANR